MAAGTARRGVSMPQTKTIIVYKNGDAYFPGRKIVVNPRQVTTFDNFLTSLSRGLESPFGAVRKLYTPTYGHKVWHLDDLKHGSVYVAAGSEKFKKLDYCEISTRKPQNKKNETIRPVVHSRLIVSARCNKTKDESCTIHVFTNGDILAAPVRIRIPKYTLTSWDNVLAMVTDKVRLRTGAVFRLCTLDGQAVCGPSELENNQHYVAVGAEKFKALPYDHCIPCRDLIRENNTSDGEDILPAARKAKPVRVTFAHAGFGEDLEPTARGHVKTYTAKLESGKQQRRQVSRIPTRYTAGEGSVFNAPNKRRETAGAAEVQEDRQLMVDLPIDQVEAKTVDEEYKLGRGVSPCNASIHDSECLCRRSPTDANTDAAKEWEASSRLGKIRTRMSRFFKGTFNQ